MQLRDDARPRGTLLTANIITKQSSHTSITMADHRRNSVYVASICYGISVIFLLLVIIGNTSDKPGLRDLWFFKFDVGFSDILHCRPPVLVF